MGTFVTLVRPDGQHLVSGNREFGFFRTQKESLVFNVRGTDRLTGFHHELGEFLETAFSAAADALWCGWSGIRLVPFHPPVPRLM